MDWGSGSPDLGRLYCPGCEPDADPFAEILDTHWCDAHMPSRDGADDAVAAAIVVSGSGEAGGDGNRRYCELFHREARRSST